MGKSLSSNVVLYLRFGIYRGLGLCQRSETAQLHYSHIRNCYIYNKKAFGADIDVVANHISGYGQVVKPVHFL